jgi:hypothetical protein
VHARGGETSALLSALRLATPEVLCTAAACDGNVERIFEERVGEGQDSRRHHEYIMLTVLLYYLQMAQQPAVAHALQVREAVCMDDYAAFFKMYGTAPGMGRALLDMFVSVVRWRALAALVRVFKPSLGVDFVARLLGFAARKGGGGAVDADAEPQGEAAALEVLPGCSAAVFLGKYPAAVRLLSCLPATSGSQICCTEVFLRHDVFVVPTSCCGVCRRTR